MNAPFWFPEAPVFALERFFARVEPQTRYDLCASGVAAFSMGELLGLLPEIVREEGLALSLGYADKGGLPALQVAIAGLYAQARPQDVAVFSGAEEAIYTLFSGAFGPGDHLIVQTPCYPSLYAVAARAGCAVSFWQARPENGWRADPAELAGLLRPHTCALVLNQPNSPTGAVFSEADRRTVVSLARQAGLWIIADEVYRFLDVAAPADSPSFADEYERTISIGSMSKAFGLPGLRVGWAFCAPTSEGGWLAAMAARQDYTTLCANTPGQWLALQALQHRTAIFERNREILTQNLAEMATFMAAQAENFSWTPPQTGVVGLARWENQSAVPLNDWADRLLRETGVLLLPGRFYGTPGQDFSAYCRLGFGRRDLSACLAQLGRVLETPTSASGRVGV